jgi:S-adenosylmethionine-diacylgycerolhomoserine-N-methlytransferase
MPDAFENMDRMYRLQRYFYDFTRKYYLLGRDQLLDEMSIQPGERVLEVGCGTARNLIILAKRHPTAHLYGLDASAAMLETANAKIDAAKAKHITVKTALADDFSFKDTFDLTDPFDKIFFSYSISMIPSWRESIDNAIRNLKPKGTIYMVDFFDQHGLPKLFRAALQKWLHLFHVHYRPEVLEYMRELEQKGNVNLTVESLCRGYSFISKLNVRR